MSRKPAESVRGSRRSTRAGLSTRLEAVRHLNTSSARRTVPVQHIVDAIVAAGYVSLDEQAKALGIHRSTAWTIIKTKHKLDRLSGKTTNRMLANPELPPSVRAVIQQYLAERSVGRKPGQRQNLLTPGIDRAARLSLRS